MKKIMNCIIALFLFGAALQISNIQNQSLIQVYACNSSAECQSEIDAAKQKRSALQEEQKALEAKSASTQEQIQNIIKQIASYNEEITAVNIQITNLQAQHQKLVESINIKDGEIKKRLIETQLSYETNQTLEFIADSSSITEMIDRIQTINTITQADRDLITTYEKQKEEVKKNEELQEKRRGELKQLVEAQQKLQESKQAELAEYLKAAEAAKQAQQRVLRDEELSKSQLDAIERAKNGAPTITSGSALQNEKAAFAYFVSQGYTKQAAAGIIGNFYVESGMDPNSVQIGGPGRGIGQWGYGADGGRYNALLAWAAQNGLKASDLGTQLAWTVKEMISYGMDPTMKSIGDVAAATEYFGRVWERPACLACSLQLRVSYAQQAYRRNA